MEVRCVSTYATLIGQPETAAQERLAENRQSSSFPASTATTSSNLEPQLRSLIEPCHTVSLPLLNCERTAKSPIMSFVTRRALSTLIPPKVCPPHALQPCPMRLLTCVTLGCFAQGTVIPTLSLFHDGLGRDGGGQGK